MEQQIIVAVRCSYLQSWDKRLEDKSDKWGTSRSLIDRVRADDHDAWELLADIYAPLVYSWARKSNLQESDAEDIVQDVFRRVASGLKNFEYSGKDHTFRGWLWTITRNSIRNYITKRDGQMALGAGGSQALRQISEAPDWISEAEAAEPELNPSEEAAVLKRALKLVEDDFADHIWQAFWRFTVEGHSAKDVASDFGMTAAGVRQAKFRVLARLREVLG